jgi:hypothetical protein
VLGWPTPAAPFPTEALAMTASYFENLGRSVAADLATRSGRYGADPATRERLRSVADGVFGKYFAAPGMAQDAMPGNMKRSPNMAYPPATLPPRGGGYKALDEDPDLDQMDPGEDPSGGGQLDAQTAYEGIQNILDAVGPGERRQFIARLAEYCQAAGGASTSSAPGAADRARKRLAQDARSVARIRHQRDFHSRFPGTAAIDTGQIPSWGRRDV